MFGAGASRVRGGGGASPFRGPRTEHERQRIRRRPAATSSMPFARSATSFRIW
jgi:hypothetical protein